MTKPDWTAKVNTLLEEIRRYDKARKDKLEESK